MLLTISTTHNSETDLGYLLHKNPTTLVGLVRHRMSRGEGLALEQYTS